MSNNGHALPEEPAMEVLTEINKLTCDPLTGVVFKAGQSFGLRSRQDTRWTVSVWIAGFEKRFLRYHVIWYLCNGIWPTKGLDHKDRDESNDRLDNLVEASQSENMFNVASRKGRTTPRGVMKHKATGKYRAYINKDKKEHHLGYFSTVEEAYAERRKAELRLYGRYAD